MKNKFTSCKFVPETNTSFPKTYYTSFSGSFKKEIKREEII